MALVQRGFHARWTEHPEEVPQRRPDLGTEVRPILDRLHENALAEAMGTVCS